MKVIVNVSNSFKRQAKPLLKKYASLNEELIKLDNELKDNPKLGIPLGHDAFKIRIAVQSKGKGKSGGLRIISYIETEIIGLVETEDDKTVVNLISIYDKSDTATISNIELQNLIIRLREK